VSDKQRWWPMLAGLVVGLIAVLALLLFIADVMRPF
jgi:hypothetical protein